MSSTSFKRKIWAHYKKHGRHDLPWRPPTLKLRKGKEDEFAYKILVSEVMLQQTQVLRVLPKYVEFTRRFPTVQKLAKAPLAEVLRAWQGLGYNRRAKMLHGAAKIMAAPRFDLRNLATRSNLAEELGRLPGIGPYTARAIAAFAFNQDAVFIETNIRTAILHHFFSHRIQNTRARAGMIYHTSAQRVTDAQILKVLAKLLPKGKSREWNLALMDYGAYLKKSGIRLNAKSKHYTKQSKFAGSSREARGAILKALARGSSTAPRLFGLLGPARRTQLRLALAALLAEHLIQKRGRVYTLPR